jgi:pimeloyl-ACP methyl ester carboxylesterase
MSGHDALQTGSPAIRNLDQEIGMERVTVSGAELDVHVYGTGAPLLFLHAEDYFDQHQPFFESLAARHRVIVPRHPGFGTSKLPADFRGVDDLAYLYLDLIDSMKLERPILAGASFGGWIALEMAVRSPERFAKLALLGSVGVKFGGREDRDFADILQIPEDEVRTRTFADPARWVPSYSTLNDEQLLSIARDRQATAHFAWRPYMHNPALRKWLHRVRMPTLVLWGSKDGIVAPSYAEKLASNLPNATLKMIAAAGHYPQIEKSSETAQAIDTFARA